MIVILHLIINLPSLRAQGRLEETLQHIRRHEDYVDMQSMPSSGRKGFGSHQQNHTSEPATHLRIRIEATTQSAADTSVTSAQTA